MFNSAPTPGNVPASMGENALNMVHGNHGISMATGGLDPSMINQFFNPISMMFPSLQPAADTAPAPPARAANPAHPKFDISDLPPFPTGTNPLLDPPPELYIHLDMVGITATVHFKCQFNIDALRNYADRNEKKFVPSRCPRARSLVCCSGCVMQFPATKRRAWRTASISGYLFLVGP